MLGKFIIVSLCLYSMAAPTFTKAAVILADNFDYADGPLVSVSEGKWTGHSGTAEQAAVVSGSLKLSQSLSEDVNALLAGEPYGIEQAEAIYARFTATFTALPSGATGTYFAHFKDSTATAGFRGRVFATTNGAAPGSFRLGIAAAANTPTDLFPVDLSLHTTHRVICRLAMSDNTATLWVDPRSESDVSATSTDSATQKAISAFAFRQSLSSGAGMGELTVDDLVVATTFEEVAAPELASAMKVEIVRSSGNGVRLHWLANPELKYSVLQGDWAGGPFVVIAAGLQFSDGQGEYLESTADAPARFYCVCSP
jgi:hypothetical protein